jgi:Carboxypeptidase regulatory-like domain
MMKMKPCMWMKRTNSRTVLAALALALVCAAMPSCASAQVDFQKGPRHDPIERIATGKVVDKEDAPIPGAVVYLKNTHTNTVRTYIADDAGLFRFGNLAQDTDYELWAESSGTRSKSRQISSFDNGAKFYFVFKVSVTKAVSLDGPST